tara:strand:+ start:486 stop:809 length:324 start_codon:yes stop_codon:yes gene_type:complete
MTDSLPRNSWDDFYESYDGKFDERNMLHITIQARFRKEIELLGYKLQDNKDGWHKPQEGEYKFDSEENLVIIHSCPDREIFNIDINEFLEDLLINQEWTSSVELSVM